MMEYLPELQIKLNIQLQEINYIEETIARQVNQEKFDASFYSTNENAIARAVETAFQENGYICTQVFAVLNWNIPGPYFGRSFCKAYLTDTEGKKIHLYQADIDLKVMKAYLRHECDQFIFTFNHILNSNGPDKESSEGWLKKTFGKFRVAIVELMIEMVRSH